MDIVDNTVFKEESMNEMELMQFLRDNLSIEVKTDSYDYDNKYLVVRLMLKGEVSIGR